MNKLSNNFFFKKNCKKNVKIEMKLEFPTQKCEPFWNNFCSLWLRWRGSRTLPGRVGGAWVCFLGWIYGTGVYLVIIFVSVEIVETFFCFGGAKVFIRQMKRLVKEMIARGEWADKTSRRFRRLNLSLFSIFWKLITSFVICREFLKKIVIKL